MADSRFILTVNGGRRKTTAAFWTRDGHLLSRAHGAGCDPLDETSLAVIDGLWREVCGVVGLDVRTGRCEVALSLTLKGAAMAAGRANCRRAFGEFRHSRLSSHEYGALMGAFGGGPGAVMVVDRGVSGCCKTQAGEIRSLGGWGLPSGDRGGGTWLGMQLIADYLQWHDGTADMPDSALWPELQSVIGADRDAILAALAANTNDVADWPPVILAAANAGDAVAIDLVEAARNELTAFATSLRGTPPLPLQITGDLGRALRPWLAIGEDTARASPHRGAYLIGRGDIPPQFET